MFGRFDEIDDKPGWREKLAEWRDSPLFVFERPDWMAEGLLVLILMFVGIASLMLSVAYLTIPADALPNQIPGRWVAPVTTSTSSTTSTTTTTVPASRARAAVHSIAALPPDQRQAALGYIRAVVKLQQQQAVIDKIVSSPPVPPSRQWAYAFLSAVLGVGLLVLAWFLSDRRARIMFQR